MVKMEPLRVTFVHPNMGIGGAERLVLDVAVALADQGVEVEFVTNHFNKKHAFEELKSGKYPVTVIGDWLPSSICGSFQALCAYFKMMYLAVVYYFFALWKQKGNIFFVDQIPIAVPILKYTGQRVIYYCHHPDLLASPPGGFLKRFYRRPIDWLEMYGTDKADAILVNSEYTVKVFRKVFPKICRNLTVLYPSISSSFLHDIARTKRKPIHEIAPEICLEKPTDVTFLSINRFHPAKNLNLAIEAMSVLLKKLSPTDFNRIHLIMAGGFDPASTMNEAYFKQLVELTHAKDLIIKVVFLKSPSDQLKAELLKACDCLIYTPVNEHFGIVPLEAMAASKPVIACNSGGPCETIEHEITGYLCDPKPEAVAHYMAKMLDRNLSKVLGQKGLKRMEKLFSNTAFSKQCMDVVNKTFTMRD